MREQPTFASRARFFEHGFGFLTIARIELYVRVSVTGPPYDQNTRIDLFMCDEFVPLTPKKKTKKQEPLGVVITEWFADDHLKHHLRELIVRKNPHSLDEPMSLFLDSADGFIRSAPLAYLT